MKKKILSVFAGLLLASGTQADVPHTFSSGTPANAEEVNANFQHVNYGNFVVKDGNGNEIGSLISVSQVAVSYNELSTTVLNILSPQGYFFCVNGFTGDLACQQGSAHRILYLDTSCQGSAYTRVMAGTVINGGGTLYYVQKNASKESITLNDDIRFSYAYLQHENDLTIGLREDFCSQGGGVGGSGTIEAYPALNNDPTITGVSTDSFTTPITIERR